jgi:hypothetical protein
MYPRMRAAVFSTSLKNRLQEGKNLRVRWAKRNDLLLVAVLCLDIFIPVINTLMCWKLIQRVHVRL